MIARALFTCIFQDKYRSLGFIVFQEAFHFVPGESIQQEKFVMKPFYPKRGFCQSINMLHMVAQSGYLLLKCPGEQRGSTHAQYTFHVWLGSKQDLCLMPLSPERHYTRYDTCTTYRLWINGWIEHMILG